MENDKKKFCDDLKEFFKAQGLTQQNIAERFGVSQQYVASLLNGTAPFGKKVAHKWAEEFGLPEGWLLTGNGYITTKNIVQKNQSGDNYQGDGMTVNQTIKKNSGQNAGRDINNPPCPYGEQHFMAELEAQRKHAEHQLEVYAASLEKKDEQIRNAQLQIDTLIKQNQEQFNRFMSLLEKMQGL